MECVGAVVKLLRGGQKWRDTRASSAKNKGGERKYRQFERLDR